MVIVIRIYSKNNKLSFFYYTMDTETVAKTIMNNLLSFKRI